MPTVPTLEDALLMAVEAHRGQTDKAGQPYILHPIRVMLSLKTRQARVAGVLHDLIEDTAHSLEELRQLGYPPPVLEALDCLTRRSGESYAEFVERIKVNDLARQVKLADLQDNMDVRRLATLTDKDVEHLRRYVEAWRSLARVEEDERPS